MRIQRATAIAVGALLGVGAALAALRLHPSREPGDFTPISGRLLDEASGPIDAVAFHYVPESEPITGAIYRAFLSSLAPDTRLLALVPPPQGGVDASAELRSFLRSLPNGEALVGRTKIAVASGPISPWSKDRALVSGGALAKLYLPVAPSGPGERRRADWQTPLDLARAFPLEVRASMLPLDFDAGDFAVTGGRLLVDANLVGKNAGRGFDSPEKLALPLARLFGMPVVVLGRRPGDVPRHHLSMYLTPLTEGVVLLGDPREGRRLVGEHFAPGEASPDTGRPLVADFSAESLARYDRAAADLQAAGFRVVRIPTVPFDDQTYFAYTNGIFETRAGKRVAWMPVFDVPVLDQAARRVYTDLGWEVRPVPSRAAFAYHGTIGCLANVLTRGAP